MLLFESLPPASRLPGILKKGVALNVTKHFGKFYLLRDGEEQIENMSPANDRDWFVLRKFERFIE